MTANLFSHWLKKLVPAASRRQRRSSSRSTDRSASRWRPLVELLEDRLTPTTFSVTDLTDAAGSAADVTLRYAVNTAQNGDTINFAVTGTITLGSSLAVGTNLAIAGPGAANLAISGNNAVQVFNVSSTASASISGLTIENGLAAGGGGINNQGTLNLTNDAISNNATLSNTTVHNGAGIYNAGTLTVSASTINGNSANNHGGGIYNTGTATLSNSTIAGNTASSTGGGIYNLGTLMLIDATVSRNSAGNATDPFIGGGLCNSGTLHMSNTIVAANTGNNGPDIYGTIGSANYCLIGNSSGNTIASGANNLVGVSSPGLATALANNGGPTPTLALMPGSPAIGTGAPGQAGTTAQNGVIRAGAVDIGAYQTPPTVAPSTANLAHNSTTITINGSNFDPNPANDTVAFNLGAAGTVTAATATQLTVAFSTQPALGTLTGVVTADGNSSGVPVPVATVVNTTWMVTDSNGTAGSGSASDVTLPYAIATAINGDTITFASSLTGGNTIALGSTLNLINNLTITNLSNPNLAISGGGTVEVFSIAAGTTDSISGLTIENGQSSTYGGGIYNSGTLTLTADTFFGNTATYLGGAIYNYTGATLTVVNTTITANTATYEEGGGLFIYGTATLIGDTISGNTAGYYSGGIINFGTASLDNTIVAGNTAPNAPDASGTFTSSNYNLIGNTSLNTVTGTGNLLNVSAGLASALAFNGGLTPTLALMAGSAAIGAGDPSQGGTTAQNGILRPAIPDIGAVQHPVTVTPSTAILPVNSTSMVIFGSGFDPNPANDTVTFDNGVTGIVTFANYTSLGISLTGLSSVPVGTALHASVAADGTSSGSPMQVAAVSATATIPTVAMNAANVADNSITLSIGGTNFDPTAANNTVLFNQGATGTVTSATATQLTVTLSTPPRSLGTLAAVVTTDGVSSGTPVQVATEVNGNWVVTDSGSGSASLSDVTLPYAVANSQGGDTIAFAGSLSGAAITLTSTLTVGHNLTITGLGAANLAVSGGGTVEVFNIGLGTTAAISGLTIENGHTSTLGGGVLNHGTLTLTADILSGNFAGTYGGAIYNYTGQSLTVLNSTIASNIATDTGAGINNLGTLTLTNSTVFGNTTTNNYGGGVYNDGTATLTSDTIADNSAGGYGGGTMNFATVYLDNTIIAGNTATHAPDAYGGYAASNYNLIGNNSSTTFTGAATGNLVNVSAGLASALAYNGGPTPTLALLPGSAAIGAGDPGQAGTTAQNGVIRPTAPDIGAAQHFPVVVTPSTANLLVTSTSMVIQGTGFDPNSANDTVTFDNGVTGTVTSAASTTLMVTLTGLSSVPVGTVLHAGVTADGFSSGSLVQVATVVGGSWIVTDSNGAAGSGSAADVTLPYAVTHAQNGDTIHFAGSLSGDTIDLTATLAIDQSLTIIGLGAANLAVSGNNAVEVFNVSSTASASISGLTIENGVANNGGGIYNSGTLALTNDAISNNTSFSNVTNASGGGIYNSGTLTVNGSTINGNSAFYNGGGLYNTGTATLSNTTVFGNAAYTSGAGIYNSGTLTLTDATVSHNNGYGGLTFLPQFGGGISNSGAGTLNMENTIVAGNITSGTGPDIDGTIANANYCLIGNSSGTSITSGGNNLLNVSAGLATSLANNGGPTQTLALLSGSAAIYAGDPGQTGTTSQNALVRPANPDIGAYQGMYTPTVTPSNANLADNAPSISIDGTYFDPNPTNDVVTFDNGVTGTVISASATTLNVSLTGLSSVAIGTALDASVTVHDTSSGAPVQVATVSAAVGVPTITASTTNVTDNGTTITISGTNFDPIFTNDIVTFNLGVTGIVTAANTNQLTVTISTPPTSLGNLTAVVASDAVSSGAPAQVATEVNGNWVVTDSGNGAGNLSDVTLPYAVGKALSGDTISFASSLSGATITLSSTLTINTNVTIAGLGAANLAVSGNNAVEVFTILSGVTANISGLTIENGSTNTGGGVLNLGTLTLSDSTVTHNLAHFGGGIFNHGTMTLTADTISNNGTLSNTTIFFGAGIYTEGTLTVSGSTINGNTANTDGGGLYNTGTATLSNSTIAENAAYTTGGGISNTSTGMLTLTDCTIADNGGWGGNPNNPLSGGGICNHGTLQMSNTIVAGNSTTGNGPDIYGTIAVANHCLIGNTSGTMIASSTGNLLNVNADLATALANNGGPTLTLALMPGSPAIGAGDPGQAGTTAQNGVTRPAAPDIGAYQTPPAVAATVTGLSPTTGPAAGGTVVTITGTGFTGATAVDFGPGNAATNVTVNAAGTQVTASAPSGTGTVDVTVTVAVGGTSATSSADQFTYVAAPTVTGLSPTTGPAAGGTSVSITGTGFTTASTVAFGSTAATSVTFTSATSLTAVDPSGTGVVDVTVTTPVGGTSATSAADQFTYTGPTFQVSSTTLLSGNNGFLVTFSAPYNISQLSLYDDDSGHTLTTRGVQITGPSGTTIFGGTTNDSVRFNAVPVNSTQLELIESGLNHLAGPPVLQPGNYIVTLDGGSGDSAFRRLSDGAFLNGSGSGTITTVDNYTSPTLTVTAIPGSTDVVTIGDLVAGPGQTLTVPLVLGGGTGSVSQTTAVNLSIAAPANGAYSVTGFTLNSALTGTTVSFNAATGSLSLSSATTFATNDNPLLLGTFTFAVPGLGNGGTAPGIDTKTPISITVTSVLDANSNPKPFIGVNGFHLTAYLGNVIAPVGIYNSTNVSQIQGLIVGALKAFALYPNVDPLLLADVTKAGTVNATSVSQLEARIVGAPSAIPALPAGSSGMAVNGADPVLFVGSTYTPNGQPANLGNLTPGSTVLVPLSVFVTDPHGVNVTAAEVAFSFDPKVFTLNGVSAGAIANGSLGGSPFAVAFAEVAPGELNVIGSSSIGPNLAYGQTATLFLVSLTVRADAPAGSTVFNLMSSEESLQTGLQDNLGRNLVLSPAPSNSPGDTLDGAFTVQSGKAVQQLTVGLVGTSTTVGKAGSVTALTPAAWEQLTTQLFGTAGDQVVLNGSNGGLAVAAAAPVVTDTPDKKQHGSNSLAAWEHLTTQLFKAAGNETDLNGNPPTL